MYVTWYLESLIKFLLLDDWTPVVKTNLAFFVLVFLLFHTSWFRLRLNYRWKMGRTEFRKHTISLLSSINARKLISNTSTWFVKPVIITPTLGVINNLYQSFALSLILSTHSSSLSYLLVWCWIHDYVSFLSNTDFISLWVPHFWFCIIFIQKTTTELNDIYLSTTASYSAKHLPTNMLHTAWSIIESNS